MRDEGMMVDEAKTRESEPIDGAGPDDALELWTSSRGRSFRACQRMHYFRYVQRIVALTERAPLRFGTGFHIAIEQYWLAPSGAGLEAAMAAAVLPDPFDQAKLRAMVFGYCLGWDVRRPGYIAKVIAVELQYTTPMINPASGRPSRTWVRAGKVDVKVLLVDGRVAVIEHKMRSRARRIGASCCSIRRCPSTTTRPARTS